MIRSALVIMLLTLISVGFATVIAVFTDKAKPVRWPAAMIAGGVLLAGWVFIFWQNSFHVTTPVVIVALGYVAVVSTVFNLWRTGAAAVAPNEEDDGDASWGVPIGARGELEREKRTLLKAIKEAEFDLQMNKLSKADAESMIKTFRARAIEVIKEIEKLDAGAAGSVRERIEREVRARLEIEAAVEKKTAAVVAAKQAKKDKKRQRGGDRKAEPKGATAVDAAEATPAEDATDLASTPQTAADVAASGDGPSAAATELATETAANAAEIASVVETPAAAERAAVAEAVAEAATDADKAGSKTEKDESSTNESSKNESSKNESAKADEPSKHESSKKESAKADEPSKKPGAKEAAS